ncbi:MAG: restriction endonuclease [Candidatus Omnitrophica bacterium]|nr:restriction endonuclease [Candidatus Omnitrophota bacterium]
MGSVDVQHCGKHPDKIAIRFCRFCNLFLCLGCTYEQSAYIYCLEHGIISLSVKDGENLRTEMASKTVPAVPEDNCGGLKMQHRSHRKTKREIKAGVRSRNAELVERLLKAQSQRIVKQQVEKVAKERYEREVKERELRELADRVRCREEERVKREAKEQAERYQKERVDRERVKEELKIQALKIEEDHRRKKSFWQELEPLEFEKEVARIYDKKGLGARLTAHSNDGGVDIFLNDGTVVQCKHQEVPVAPRIVRELYGVMVHEEAPRAILVCSGGFSRNCFDWAKGKPIELIDLDELVAMQMRIKASV